VFWDLGGRFDGCGVLAVTHVVSRCRDMRDYFLDAGCLRHERVSRRCPHRGWRGPVPARRQSSPTDLWSDRPMVRPTWSEQHL